MDPLGRAGSACRSSSGSVWVGLDLFDWDHEGSFAHPLLYFSLLLWHYATHDQCRSLIQSNPYSLELTIDVIDPEEEPHCCPQALVPPAGVRHEEALDFALYSGWAPGWLCIIPWSSLHQTASRVGGPHDFQFLSLCLAFHICHPMLRLKLLTRSLHIDPSYCPAPVDGCIF